MMNALIENKFTAKERMVLDMLRSTDTRELWRIIRLSLVCTVGAGVFVALAIWQHKPWYGVVPFAAFAAWISGCLSDARDMHFTMHGVIEKFEDEIERLRKTKEEEGQ